jgi:hypothetical protein
VDSRETRVARNESLFRQVNERIEAINRASGALDEAEFLCECGDAGCTLPITLTLGEYEGVRTHPARFAIAKGHDIADLERVVFEGTRYAVVEKEEATAARIAFESDPRA